MIRLPKGVTIYKGGNAWTGHVPVEHCPPYLKPVPDTPPAPAAPVAPTRRKRGKRNG